MGSDGASAVARMLTQNTQVPTALPSGHLHCIFYRLLPFIQLRRLDLSHSGCDAVSAATIAEGLGYFFIPLCFWLHFPTQSSIHFFHSANTSLRELVIRKNMLTDPGFEGLRRSLCVLHYIFLISIVEFLQRSAVPSASTRRCGVWMWRSIRSAMRASPR
jgi:hypothetical protein